jgi:GDSL-like Lipase/Acylhydrolase family
MSVKAISRAQPSSPGTFEASDEDFTKDVAALAKWKDRSEKTHKNTHIPELTRRSTEAIDIVLLGSSMFERFKNTGASTRIGRLPRSFNAGVGGDKIPSVLYRIQLGLLNELKPFAPKLWVLSIGTNDLRPNGPFGPRELEGYSLVLKALIRAVPGSRVISTAISYRRDIEDWIVDESNTGLQQLGEELNRELGAEVVRWLSSPTALDKNTHHADHVHYNKEGYCIWDVDLFPVIDEMVRLPLVEFGKDISRGEADKAVDGLVTKTGETKIAVAAAPEAPGNT